VDDWENVTWLNQMVPLPSKHPVSELLEDYRAFQEPNVIPGSLNAAVLEELTQGVREYFNLALGRILLYKQERRQYAEWRKRIMNKNDSIHKDGEKSLYQVYGAEHFLRLLSESLRNRHIVHKLNDS
jgi:mortality factor 4-like protein 1